MRAKISVEIPFVTDAQIALEFRSISKRFTLDHIIGRREDLGDFRIEERKRAGNGQAFNAVRCPRDLAFDALDLCIRGIVREEQIGDARVEDGRLQTADVDEERTAVQPELTVDQVHFPAKFVILHFIGFQFEGNRETRTIAGAAGAVQQARAEALRIGGVEQQIVAWRQGYCAFQDRTLGLGDVRCVQRIEHLLRLCRVETGSLNIGQRVALTECLAKRCIAASDEGELTVAIIQIGHIGAECVGILRSARITERAVGIAFEVDFNVVITRAERDRQQVWHDVEAGFAEQAELFVGPLDVIPEDDASRERSGIALETAREREVRGECAEWCGGDAARIGEVVAFLKFQIGIKRTQSCADTLFLRGVDPEFLREDLGLGRRGDKQVRCLAGAAGAARTRIADGAITDVIRQILADKQIVGVIDALFGFAVGICTGVDHVEHRKAPFDRPAGVGEIVFDPVLFVALDFQIVEVEIGIGEEHTVRFDGLACMRNGQAPVGCEFIQSRCAETRILGIVEIFFYQARIVGGDEVHIGIDLRQRYRVGLETGAQRVHRYAVRTDGSGRTEAGTVACGDGACNIVDITALAVEVEDPAKREIVGNRNVEHRFSVVAGFAALGERHTGLCASLEAGQRRLVGDQTDNTCLRACTEQRALRPCENFDTLKVGCIHVEVAAWLCQRLIVEVERNVGRKAGHTGGGQVGRGRGEAANIDGALARTAAACGDGGELVKIIGESVDRELVQSFLANRIYRDRNVLQVFGNLGRSDHDFTDAPGARLSVLRGGRCCRKGGDRHDRRAACKFHHLDFSLSTSKVWLWILSQ